MKYCTVVVIILLMLLSCRTLDVFARKSALKSSDPNICLYCEGTGKRKCKACDGTGIGRMCTMCHGDGRVWTGYSWRKCYVCKGKGYQKCKVCDGKGWIKCKYCNGKGHK